MHHTFSSVLQHFPLPNGIERICKDLSSSSSVFTFLDLFSDRPGTMKNPRAIVKANETNWTLVEHWIATGRSSSDWKEASLIHRLSMPPPYAQCLNFNEANMNSRHGPHFRQTCKAPMVLKHAQTPPESLVQKHSIAGPPRS